MDDFLNQHKSEYDAQVFAREAANTAKLPPSKKFKTDENSVPLTPFAIGARSSMHTIRLHEKYQALGIPQPLFTYGGSGMEGWTVTVSFPGLDAKELQGISEEKKFNSKQEAKEALSKRALEILEELENEGKVKKAEKGSGPNYVGQLLEFQRSTASPQPTYNDYQSGTRFACLITIDGHAREFGSLDSMSSSKKAARQEAARCAVEYFKSQGVWPEDVASVGGIKKKKAAQQPSSIPEMDPASTPGKFPTVASISTSSPNNMSNAQQVASLAAVLSLPTPEWRFTPHPSDKDFHSVSCFFKGGGLHEGPIGEVRNIFGKKKAKEECARLTLHYLNEVRERRVAYGQRMMEGIVGGGGEKEVLGQRQSEREMGGVSDEEFEDAVEILRG
ncbi:hypothetical protein EJ02DRAFT_340315 [Clathrospora elynae]|uniref:DRBM domain-containing protein n=1 Tax=Clathrospora elynae TaxID=706981 RepID=A0A6A5SWP8_9PLEO|nr:hypothetical protein EJ02DRAFT_340315 [Clathrospora elynae]